MKLFTYGTLREGEALDGYFGKVPRVEATVPGELYDYGAYPIANLRPLWYPAETDAWWGRIKGEIVDVTVDDFASIAMMELRAGYDCIHVDATDANGNTVTALAFDFPDTRGRRMYQRIPGDDWKRQNELDPDTRLQLGLIR